MSDESASSGEGEAVSVLTVDAGTPAELTMNGAAKALADMRFKRNQESSAESAEPATAEPELSDEDNAAPPTEATGETQEDAPAETPPRELPRSWTKDRADVWNRLDPAAQEILLDQDRKASAEVRRLQNEAAEERKALKAERDATEKERLQLVEKAKSYKANAGTQFSDIQSFDDITKMRTEDPFRFQEYQEFLWREQAARAELADADQRKNQERQSKRAAYEAEQNATLMELVPEMADPKKANELRTRAVAMLTDDLGLKNDQLTRWMADDTGHEILSNAGIQRLIADGLKYRDIQSASKAVAAKPLPPVQKPGTSKPSGGVSERVQALDNSLTNSGSLKAAQQLLAARRASQRRAS